MHTQRAHTLTYALSLHKHLLSACCMPCTVLDRGPQANLGELPQMTTCPDVTCYCWRLSRPQIVTYPGAHTPPDNQPNGSLGSMTSPHWSTGFIPRSPSPVSIGPQTWWYPPWPHEGASAPQLLLRHRLTPIHRPAGLCWAEAPAWRLSRASGGQGSRPHLNQASSHLRAHCVLSNPHSLRWRKLRLSDYLPVVLCTLPLDPL